MKNIHINETHLLAICKNANTGRLETQILPIVNEYRDQMYNLYLYSNNPYNSKENLYQMALQNGLDFIFNGYSYCTEVNMPYQDDITYPITAVDMKNKYYTVKELFQDLYIRYKAYSLSKMYDICSRDKSIVAFSNNRLGWTRTHFDLNKDLSIEYNTNFGYGRSSYFTANLKYKNIDILPYSMWVTYYNIQATDILRFTRAFNVSNEAWRDAMNFGCSVCNSMIDNPSQFADTWLVSEVEKMVDGLKNIFNDQDNIIAVNESNGNMRALTTNEEKILYKGEKISGALSFLDKIKEIESLNISMSRYIQTIIDLNKQMIPQYEKLINQNKNLLINLKASYNSITSIITPLENYVTAHIEECTSNFIGSKHNFSIEAEKIMERVSPNFLKCNTKLKELEEKRLDLSKKISYAESVLNTLNKYINRVLAVTDKQKNNW